jgi:hypothetical protein
LASVKLSLEDLHRPWSQPELKRFLSEDKRKLQYTEYFGDGESKAFCEVENWVEKGS